MFYGFCYQPLVGLLLLSQYSFDHVSDNIQQGEVGTLHSTHPDAAVGSVCQTREPTADVNQCLGQGHGLENEPNVHVIDGGGTRDIINSLSFVLCPSRAPTATCL